MQEEVLLQRGQAYEGAEDNGEEIAKMWTIMFRPLLKDGAEFHAEEVWKGMLAVKLVRDVADKKLDTPLDGANYGTLWLASYLARQAYDKEQEDLQYERANEFVRANTDS